MPDVSILSEPDLRDLLSLDDDIVACVEDAFKALATKPVVMPPVLHLEIAEANGEIDVKTAYVPGLDSLAMKMSPGFFDNPKIGLPSLNGLMILFSAKTGLVEAVFLDNGYLTDVRTAAAGAVAARHLAPKVVKTAGVMGTGVQARLQLQAAHLVRPFEKALVWGRDFDKAEAAASDLKKSLGISAEAVDDPERLVSESQLVVTTTPATEPILSADWLHPGLHITAMGSDQDDKNEIDPLVLQRSSLVVCDRIAQCELLGELRSALAAGAIQDQSSVVELGDVVSGKHAGRQGDDDITFCDLTGTGVQDTAIATFVRSRLEGTDTGTTLSV